VKNCEGGFYKGKGTCSPADIHLLTNGARPRPCLHGHGRASEEPKGLIPFIDLKGD
jgi:hypothetical protein